MCSWIPGNLMLRLQGELNTGNTQKAIYSVPARYARNSKGEWPLWPPGLRLWTPFLQATIKHSALQTKALFNHNRSAHKQKPHGTISNTAGTVITATGEKQREQSKAYDAISNATVYILYKLNAMSQTQSWKQIHGWDSSFLRGAAFPGFAQDKSASQLL